MGGFLTFRDLSHLTWTSGEVVDTLTDAAQLFIFVFSPTQQSLVGWSRNSLDVLGVKDFEIARDGNVFLRHAHGDDRFQLLNTLEQTFEQRKSLRFVYRWLRPDTEQLRWLLCRAEPVERPEGLVYEGIIGDITDELQQFGGNPLLGPTLFEALQYWVAILDTDNRVLYRHVPASLAGFNFGDSGFREEAAQSGKIFIDAFSGGPEGTRVREFVQSSSVSGTGKLRIDWGERIAEVEIQSTTSQTGGGRAVIIVRDCTDTAKLEIEGAQRVRAESFVQLASGIFHNVNNSLQTIIGYAATMHRHADDPNRIRAACEFISQLVEQAAGLTHQALALKNSLMESQVQLDLNVAVMHALNRIQDLLSTGTKVAVSLGTLSPVSANFNTLVESFEALLRLSHSSNETAGLSIQTAQFDISPDNSEGLNPGPYGKLLITASPAVSLARRNGAALADGASFAQTLDAIAANLSRCGAILRREKLGSESITLYFPLSVNASRPPVEAVSAPQILIVDDDRMVLETVSSILSEAGYPCITAESRKSAVHEFKRHSATLRLVLLDALLPTGHGSSVLRQVRRVKPDIAVIGFSGASAPDLQALVDAGASHVLRKPVNSTKLLDTVREVLSKQEAA